MTKPDAEWWPLSAAFAWIAIRRPIPFGEWPDEVAPAQARRSHYLIDDVLLPEAVKRALAAQDNGVDDALAAIAAALKTAAAEGRVRLRGRGPWAPADSRPADIMSRSELKAAAMVAISADQFSRKRLTFHLATEGLGPDDAEEAEFGDEVDLAAFDFRSFPHWADVEVNAADMRAMWPAQNEEPPADPTNRDTAQGAGQAPEARSRRGGRSYAVQDAPLLAEMEALLARGEASSLWDATLHVAPKAAGGGDLESKRKRLHSGFQKRSG